MKFKLYSVLFAALVLVFAAAPSIIGAYDTDSGTPELTLQPEDDREVEADPTALQPDPEMDTDFFATNGDSGGPMAGTPWTDNKMAGNPWVEGKLAGIPWIDEHQPGTSSSNEFP